jgi:hypothetical protein
MFSVTFMQVAAFLTPLWCLTFYSWNIEKIKAKLVKFEEKYNSLFEEFNGVLGLQNLRYYPYYFYRRIVYAFTLYNLHAYPIVQIMLNILHSFPVIYYICRYRPYVSKRNTVFNIYQEICISITFSLCYFYIYSQSAAASTVVEYTMIAVVGSAIISGYLCAIYDSVHNIIKKYRLRSSNVVPIRSVHSIDEAKAKQHSPNEEFKSEDLESSTFISQSKLFVTPSESRAITPRGGVSPRTETFHNASGASSKTRIKASLNTFSSSSLSQFYNYSQFSPDIFPMNDSRSLGSRENAEENKIDSKRSFIDFTKEKP